MGASKYMNMQLHCHQVCCGVSACDASSHGRHLSVKFWSSGECVVLIKTKPSSGWCNIKSAMVVIVDVDVAGLLFKMC